MKRIHFLIVDCVGFITQAYADMSVEPILKNIMLPLYTAKYSRYQKKFICYVKVSCLYCTAKTAHVEMLSIQNMGDLYRLLGFRESRDINLYISFNQRINFFHRKYFSGHEKVFMW